MFISGIACKSWHSNSLNFSIIDTRDIDNNIILRIFIRCNEGNRTSIRMDWCIGYLGSINEGLTSTVILNWQGLRISCIPFEGRNGDSFNITKIGSGNFDSLSLLLIRGSKVDITNIGMHWDVGNFSSINGSFAISRVSNG